MIYTALRFAMCRLDARDLRVLIRHYDPFQYESWPSWLWDVWTEEGTR